MHANPRTRQDFKDAERSNTSPDRREWTNGRTGDRTTRLNGWHGDIPGRTFGPDAPRSERFRRQALARAAGCPNIL